MEKVMAIVNWVITNKEELIQGYLMIVGGASIIVKLTPTLADDNFFKGILKFLGKYLALNRK